MDPLLSHLLRAPSQAPAIEWSGGVWSRGDLAQASERVAGGLRDLGIGPGDRVAVVVRPDPKAIAAILGARARGAFVCLVDPKQISGTVARVGATAVLTTKSADGAYTVIEDLMRASPADLTGDTGASRAWGISTSGSGGSPRTVVLTESVTAHVSAVLQEVSCYRPDDRVLCAVPIHHIYGFSQLWIALLSGACLLLAPSPLLPGTLATWADRATVLPAVPAMLRTLIGLQRKPPLRLITIAGQATLPADRQQFASAFPRAQFIQFYGLTEAPRVMWLPPEHFLSHPNAAGQPTRNVRVTLDEDGALFVEGPNVADGYLDDPVATAERFPDGRYRTGDLFERDGELYRYLGRADGMFKRLGEKVIPELVESELSSHPSVERCLVLPEPGPDGELEPVAWVVSRDPRTSAADLLKYARSRLAATSAPERVIFVPSLPSTPSGKVVRRRPS